jgi:ABC-type amino acid transport substrate-binding protein
MADGAGSRILDDGFADISLGTILRKGQTDRLAYVNEFVEEAKASGLVDRIIEISRVARGESCARRLARSAIEALH